MLEQREKLITYYDAYSKLLTQKQQMYFEAHYFEDLSFGEMALIYNVSRAAIFDQLKRCEETLLTIEAKIGIIEYKQQLSEKLAKLALHTDADGKAIITEIRAL